MVNSKAKTLFNSICNLQCMFNINTWLMTNHTQNGPQKSWQVETPSRVGKIKVLYSCFSMFLSCISWMTARCTMLASGGLPSNRESALCAPDMLHPFQLGSGLTMTYHDRLQSTRWCEVETPEPIFRSCGILILSARKKWFRCLFWAQALKPAARGLAHCFWSTKWHIDISTKRSNSFIGKCILRSYPSANLWKSQIKGRCHRSSLKPRD